MNTDEKLDVTLEWADDTPYLLRVGVEAIWRNERLITESQGHDHCVTEKTVTLPRVQAIKFSRIVLAGLQAERFLEIGERLKEQTEKLLAQQEKFREEVIRFGTERMLADAESQAHKPKPCPRCDVCEKPDCEGCDIAELCSEASCEVCPQKEGCWSLLGDEPFRDDDDDDDDDDWDDDDDDYDDGSEDWKRV